MEAIHINKRRKVFHPSDSIIFLSSNRSDVLHKLVQQGKTKAIQQHLKSSTLGINTYDTEGYTPLHYVLCSRYTVALTKLLVENGADPSLKNQKDGKNLLHLAAERNHLKLVQLLLKEYSLDTNTIDKKGETPLYITLKAGYFELAKTLLALTGHPCKSLDRSNCLHTLVRAKKTLEIDLFLKTEKIQQSINAYDEAGYAALHHTVCKENTKIIHLLLQYGADINQPTRLRQETLLHLAVKNNREDIVSLLMGKKARCDVQDYAQKTPLHFACEENNLSIASILLKQGANPNLHSNNGRNPLYYAIENHNKKMVAILLQYGADPNVKDSIPLVFHKNSPKWGRSALHWAIYSANREITKLLLEHNANPHLMDHSCRLPIHAAAEIGSVDMVRLLLHYGANLASTGPKNKTVLHTAAKQSNSKLFHFLIQHPDIEVDTVDQYGFNALHYAARGKKITNIKKLIDKGLNVNSRSFNGFTPLHVAGQLGQPNTIRYLLERGADRHATDNDGRNLFDHVISSASFRSIHMLAWDNDVYFREALFQAIRNNNRKLAKCILPYIGLDVTDEHGWSAVHHAAAYSINMLPLLTEKGYNLESRTKGGKTPLHIAACYQNLSAVIYLIKQKVNIYVLDEAGWSPFQYAATKDSKSMQLIYYQHLMTMLDAISLNTNQLAMSPPNEIKEGIKAEKNNIKDILTKKIDFSVTHLFKQLADPSITLCENDHLFLSKSIEQIMQYLHRESLLQSQKILKANANVITIHPNDWQFTSQDLLKIKQWILLCLYHNISTYNSLHLLSESLNIEEFTTATTSNLERLLQKYDWIFFETAISDNLKKIRDFLSRAGTTLIKQRNDAQDNTVFIAAQFSRPSTLKWLLEREAESHTTNPITGNTAIHCAAQSPYAADNIALLEGAGANIDQANHNSITPLQLAARINNPVAFFALLSKTQININIRRNIIVQDAARTATPATMQRLFQSDIDLDSLDVHGNTTLHTAAKAGNFELVDFLIHYFPNLYLVRNNTNHTPLEEAIRALQIEIQTQSRTSSLAPALNTNKEKSIALLWMHQKRNGRAHETMRQVIQTIAERQPSKTLFYTTIYFQITMAKKESIQKELSKIGCFAQHNAFFYSKGTLIESITRLTSKERYTLYSILRIFSSKKLPNEISMMIGHRLWAMIKTSPENQLRMQAYPSLIENALHTQSPICSETQSMQKAFINPAELYAGLEAARRGASSTHPTNQRCHSF